MSWRRGVRRPLRWTAATVGVLLVAWLGYEMSLGSRNPLAGVARRGSAILRHVGILPTTGWGAYEPARYTNSTAIGVGSAERTTSETFVEREPVYALGLWPTGMHYSVTEVSHDGPLGVTGLRLVWWAKGQRHVVDTADRANGRVPEGATSIRVSGWIPFEATAYGLEDIGTPWSVAEWRMRTLSGDKDR